MRKTEVVVAGHVCLDITPKFEPKLLGEKLNKVLSPGKLTNVDDAVVSTGGAVSNTGLALKKLGINTGLITKVGDDTFGRAILQILSCRGDTRGVKISKGEGSSYSVVIAIPGIDRMFLHSPGTNNTFNSSDIDYDIVKRTKLFHLGYPTLMRKLYLNDGEELVKIFRKVKSLGTVSSLDMALPDPLSESGRLNWTKVLKKALKHVDMFLPSFEEIFYMVDKKRYMALKSGDAKGDILDKVSLEDLRYLSGWCLGQGAKIIVIKCGHKGIYLKTGRDLSSIKKTIPIDIDSWAGREIWIPCFKVDRIASATGAGDSAIAGFLAGFLRNENAEMTLRCAVAAGAQNLRGYDSLSGLGNWKEVRSMAGDMKNKLNMFEIKGKGWIFNRKSGIWEKKYH